MGEVVNLGKVRKAADRQRDQKVAAANRVKYGRSKSERKLETARSAKALRDLDQHRVETGVER
jgi:hypothetical protein